MMLRAGHSALRHKTFVLHYQSPHMPRGAAGAGAPCSINIRTPVGVPNTLRSSYQPVSGTGSPGLHSVAKALFP